MNSILVGLFLYYLKFRTWKLDFLEAVYWWIGATWLRDYLYPWFDMSEIRCVVDMSEDGECPPDYLMKAEGDKDVLWSLYFLQKKVPGIVNCGELELEFFRDGQYQFRKGGQETPLLADPTITIPYDFYYKVILESDKIESQKK